MAEKIRVLYVDDESALLELCKVYLERSGDFIVAITPGAPEAIRLLEIERFEAIISDYQMPEMDGIEFLKVVRARGDKTPFVIFTGKGREEVVIEALNAGADFYIQKGGEPKSQFAELAHKIKKAVKGRQAERALVESERKYRHLIEHSGEAIAVVQDGMLRLVNHRAVEFTGYSERELLSMPFSVVIHPDDRAMVVERHQKRLKGEERFSRYTFRLSPKDMSTRWVEISAVKIDWDGHPATLNFLTDITERKQAEDALQENRVRLDLALRSAEMGIWHWDIIHDRRSFDAQTCHLLGIDPATFTGSAEEFFAVVHPDDREKLKTALARTVEHDMVYEPSYRVIWLDGSVHHIIARGRLVRDSAGKPERINGIIWDTTDRRLAEEALRTSEARFREQYQNNPIAIFTWQHRDDDFILIDCNKAAKTLTDGRANDFIGRAASEMYATRPEIIAEIKQAFSQQTGISKELISEHFLPGRLVRTIASCVPPDLIMVHMEDITKRKKMEAALRESEERYRRLTDNALDVIYRMSLPDGKYEYVSPAATTTFGYSPQEFYDNPQIVRKIIHPDWIPYFENQWQRLLKEDVPPVYEYQIVHKNGDIRWINQRNVLVRDEQGNPVALEGIVTDITEQKQVEESLRKSEERLRHISELIPDFAYSCKKAPDGDFAIDWITGAPERITGYTTDELKEMTCWKFLVIDEDIPVFEKSVTGLSPGESVRCELRIRRKDGGIIWLSSYATCVTDLKDPGYLRLFGGCQDITTRKQTEKSLQESEMRYRSILDTMQDAYVQADAKGHIITANPPAARLFRCDSANDLRGLPAESLYRNPEERREIFRILTEQGEVHDFICEGVRKDGTGFWASINVQFTFDSNGEVTGTDGFIRDITERKEAEKELQITQEKYTKAFLSVPDALTISELDSGRYIEVNDAATRIFGYSRDELIGKSALELGIWRDKEDRDRLIDQVRKHGKASQFEVINWRKSGELFNAVVNADTLSIGNVSYLIAVVRDITNRKKMEAALVESEAKSRSLLERVPELILVHRNGTILYTNPAVEKILGYQPHEALNRQITDFIAPEFHERVAVAVRRRIRGEPVEPYEIDVMSRNGSRRNMVVNGSTIEFDGAPASLIILTDITERKKTEEALHGSEERFRQIAESAGEWIWEVDADGLYTYSNATISQILGYAPEEVIGRKHFYDFFVPEDRDRLRDAASGAFANCEPFKGFVNTNLHKNGDRIILETSGYPVLDTDGTLTGYRGTDIDITARKRADEEIKRAGAYNRSLIETSLDPLVTINPDGKISDVNAATVTVTGFSRAELIGTDFSRYFTEPDRARTGYETAFRDGSVRDYALEIQHRDGHTIPVLYNASVFRDESGNIAGVFTAARDITEQKKVEKALQERERELADIINFLPDATFVIDKKGTVLAWNRAIEEMTGVPAKQIIGKADYEYALPFYHERRPITVDLVLHYDPAIASQYPFMKKEGNSLLSEIYIPHFNKGRGAYLWFKASPLYDMAGNISGAIESIRDITDRKQVEEALRDTHEKYTKAFLSAPDAIAISELDSGRFIEVNDAATRMFGYSRDELMGKSAVELGILVNNEDRDHLIDLVRKQGRVSQFEIVERRKSGELYNALINADMVSIGNVPYLITIVQDITDRKKMETALRKSEERYRNVVEDQTEFICRFLPDGTHIFVNDAYCRYFDMKREEMIGHRFTPKLHPEDREIVALHLAELTPEHPVENIDQRIIMPDGSTRWQRWSDRAIFDENGRIIEYQSVGRDITDQKRAEIALRQAYKQLNLLSSITRHDIKNQVFALRGYIDLSREMVHDPTTLVKFLESEDLAAKTIEEQISFTKDYQEMGAAVPAWQNVNASVQKAITSLPMRNVRVGIDRTDLEVFADPLFGKVFYNLIDNALKYGGDQIKTIHVSSQESDQGLAIVCEDDGVGITDDDKKNLFRKGFGKHTGLGLFLTREILSITGITITENGVPGKGARFEITVPKGMYRFTGTGKK
jgi:PAS domain S-box-containing protein